MRFTEFHYHTSVKAKDNTGSLFNKTTEMSFVITWNNFNQYLSLPRNCRMDDMALEKVSPKETVLLFALKYPF